MTSQQIIDDAVAAFGHVEGIDTQECLVRRIMQMARFADERLSALNTNVKLAQENQRLRRLLEKAGA